MYLSRIQINTRRRETMKALASPQIIHAAIASSFPVDDNKYFDDLFADNKTNAKSIDTNSATVTERSYLWRIDKLAQSSYIMVQSAVKPDFTHITEQFGWPEAEQKWQTRDYEPFLTKLANGQNWHFRLRANPVHSVKMEDAKSENKRSVIMQHITVKWQKNWLEKRVDQLGVKMVSFDVVYRETMSFHRDKNNVTISVADFEGDLIIDDVTKLATAMRCGVGRAKAYGCGLLTLARK